MSPGDRLCVMVSSEAEPDAAVVRLPSGRHVPIAIDRVAASRSQPVRTGSCVEVAHDDAFRPADGLVVSTWLWMAPGAQGGSRRALVSSWGGDGADGWALTLDLAGRPCFEVAAGGVLDRVVAERALDTDVWWFISGELDPGEGRLTISARHGEDAEPAALARVPARLSAPGPAPGPLMIAAEARIGESASHLDGKLEEPTVRGGHRGVRVVAAWSLGEGRGARVPDRGPRGLDGSCVNGPFRAVTGRSWAGDVHDWRSAPEQYGAMHFHSDATDDLGWEPTLALEIPDGFESGVCAVTLSAGDAEDVVPFVVRGAPPGDGSGTVVLLPTFTYLAYSCERDAPRQRDSAGAEDAWVAGNRLRSLYDRFDDGCGVYEASARRPLTQLRPGYRCPQHGGPHGLAQDLILLGFLERHGIAADVMTDHDLHDEGSAGLSGYRTVITGAHPEYVSSRMLDALEDHVAMGGRLVYLGGNGLNGRVSVDPARPHVIELRRNDTQGLAWQALPGEHHHASGAYGGDWRRQGRPEHRILGVGLSAFGEVPGGSYAPIPTEDPAAGIVFAGVDLDRPIGHSGAVLGCAAGFEVDNHDPVLGSPPDSVRLATAAVGDDYSTWPDDVRDGPAAAPKRRSDIVLRRPEGGGAVFSVGSIAWTGCLIDDDNPIARITANVLAEIAKDQPFRG